MTNFIAGMTWLQVAALSIILGMAAVIMVRWWLRPRDKKRCDEKLKTPTVTFKDGFIVKASKNAEERYVKALEEPKRLLTRKDLDDKDGNRTVYVVERNYDDRGWQCDNEGYRSYKKAREAYDECKHHEGEWRIATYVRAEG